MVGVKVVGYKRKLFFCFDGNVKIVLELGVGIGLNLVYYGGRILIINVIGVDLNEKMVCYVKEVVVVVGFLLE